MQALPHRQCRHVGRMLRSFPSIASRRLPMNNPPLLLVALAAAVFLSACGKDSADSATADAPADSRAAQAAPADAPAVSRAAPAAPATDPSAAPATGFDIASLPQSEAPVGEFPFFAMPQGYSNERRSTTSKDFARFPFWVDGQVVWVEGRFYGTALAPVEGKTMSEYEVKRNFEAMVTQLGGRKVSEGRIPREVIDGWGTEITQGFNAGLGDVWNAPVSTYVVRHADGNIWLHLVTNSAQGWYVVGREQGFEQSAALLPAGELGSRAGAADAGNSQPAVANGTGEARP